MTGYESPAKTSLVLECVAGAIRRAPFLRRRGGLRLLAAAAAFGFGPRARVSVGRHTLELDARHRFHRLMILGLYEPELERFLQSVLRPGDAYVDVGAEVGYVAALAGERIGPGGKMLLFEPDPRIHARLKRHIESAPERLAPRTTILERACSDRAAEYEMLLAPLSGQSLLLADQEEAVSPVDSSVRVKSVVLDDALESEGFERVRLLKMDVEGHEIAALRGLERALERRAIDYVVVEQNNGLLERNGFTGAHLHAVFAHHGYQGRRESGGPITRESLASPVVENLFYAAEGASPNEPFSLEEIAELYRQSRDPACPEVESLRLIALARRAGGLERAIARGLAFLERHPGRVEFRGHVAHWLRVAGNIDEARAQYARILEEVPDEENVRRILSGL